MYTLCHLASKIDQILFIPGRSFMKIACSKLSELWSFPGPNAAWTISIIVIINGQTWMISEVANELDITKAW